MTQSGQTRMGPDHLLYKENWPAAKERFLALWAGEITDRACISVTAPRGEQHPVPEPTNWEVKYADIDYVIARTNVELSNTYFGGEAVPSGGTSLGYAAYGGEPVFDENTIWVRPGIHDWETPYRFDPDNRWCQRFIELVWAMTEDGNAHCKYLVDTGGIHGPLDGLLFLRGSQNLCMDLVEHPDEVKAALKELKQAWKWMFEARHARVPENHGWSTMGMWAPGRFGPSVCDFGALIGPKHYREFALPDLEEIANSLDYSAHELDGPGNVKHLPALLEIGPLSAIQWVRGARNMEAGSALQWVSLCKQIQAAGKVVSIGVDYDEVEPFLREMDPRRLFIVTTAPSVEAAEALLQNAKRWSSGRVLSVP